MDKIVELPSSKSPTNRHQGLRKLSSDLISKARDETAAQIVQFRDRLHAWRTRVAPASAARRHQGLRKLSPDIIGKARDETTTQVMRIGLTFLATAAFCLLSLLSPDSALLGGSERINVPLGIGPVSFVGFMLLGPAVLIALRVYLQIYVEHSIRLDRLARSVSIVRAPTLVPLDNRLIRLVSGLIFYALLPVAILLFAWKAAVFPLWPLFLVSVAVAAIAMTLFWRYKGRAQLSLFAAIITAYLILTYFVDPNEGIFPFRPFYLYRANLSGHWLKGERLLNANLREANLARANLSDAILGSANLAGADLTGATLTRAYLVGANLTRADLSGSDLSGSYMPDVQGLEANMTGAKLSRTQLSRAFLRDANMTRANLRGAFLTGAKMTGAILSHADLRGASLGGADLSAADLSEADLSDADLTSYEWASPEKRLTSSGDAKNLTQTQLDKACGNSKTKLPEGLTLSPYPPDR
jgi:uncharacterized protein YjbI with pentapeptide repeats